VIERDPVYDEVRETAEFRALAADARRFAARERAAVEELRRLGKIPLRPATRHPARDVADTPAGDESGVTSAGGGA